ncbi:ABC transporter ATP-binding protein [Streptomyces sp. HC44]|uniref:ABC transporter ATP-binding protein n=1 Tax=Streptomyces scabichelini TaxID=2711217 RepID=A0A6G4UY07_9ACTN|nr:ABC transporter ATP-binding protein [Streptomyces scabichelini]NGO06658.1 ABC transporter ATP-binding protein [Streptomyces scabichelini]
MTDIEIRGLTKTFGPIHAVDDVSFTAPAGQVTGFLGPNGAGKTTTLRMLLGLERPTGGTAVIGGRAYRELASPRRTVGAVLEASGLHPGRRGRTHLELLARAAGLPRQRVDEVLETVGLGAAADRRAGGYSLGMRQRLAVAGALLGDPEVLVLDEPTNGLDPAGVRWLRDLLRQLAGEGRTVLVSSHLLAEVTQYADRVVIIAGGRLRYEGPVDGLTTGGQSFEDAFLALVEPEGANL